MLIESPDFVSIQIDGINISGFVSNTDMKFEGIIDQTSIHNSFVLGKNITSAIPNEVVKTDTICIVTNDIPHIDFDRQLIAASIFQKIRFREISFRLGLDSDVNAYELLVEDIDSDVWSFLYLSNVGDILNQVSNSQRIPIHNTVTTISESLANGGLLHTFGTGHSHLLAEEIFYRAGGLAAIYPILDTRLMLHKKVVAASKLERNTGIAEEILAKHPISPLDSVIVISNSGGNQVTIELIKLVKACGAKVIAVTSINHATSPFARSNALKKIHELADIVLDNSGVVGDASILLPSAKMAVGPTSTVIGGALLQSVIVGVVSNLTRRGLDPEIFLSSNVANGDEVNSSIFEKYKNLIDLYQ